MTNKDIIYVNGDSFTEGCEISHHLASFSKKFYSINEIREHFKTGTIATLQRKHWNLYHLFFKKNKDISLSQKMMDYQFNNRWSKRLEKKLNRKVFNLSSSGGSSMQAITYKTLTDLYSLTVQGYNITDIIIQLTSSSRYSFFKNTLPEEEPPLDPSIPIIERQKYNIISANPHSKTYSKFAESIFIEEQGYSFLRYIFEVYTLVNSIKANYNSRIILLDSMFYRPTCLDIQPTSLDHLIDKNHFLFNFKEQLDKDVELSMIECIDHDEPDTMTMGGHFTSKVHDIFAEKISNRYFK
jgi:hypothetical protein